MKKILYLIVAFCFLSLNVSSQNISLKLTDVTVKEAIKELEKKSGYLFVYFSGELDTKKRISISAENSNIDVLVKQVLSGQNVLYEIDGKNIIIKHAIVNEQQGKKPKKIITGVVKDNTGLPIIAANVIEKGTTNATVTGSDGSYTLQVSEGSTLSVSYIGYVDRELRVGNDAVINIVLTENTQSLDEVVVIGYGVQKKVNLTGAVASIKTGEIQSRTQTNVVSALQGLVPGVTVVNRPGGEPTINFRGRGNLGTSEPLYVVDGVIVNSSFFASLDPNIIDNISFLKDASSSSIYGSRAAYGVILVSTKKGKLGVIQVSYNGMVGSKMLTYKPKLANSWEYAELFNEAKYNSNPVGGKNQGFSDDEIQKFKSGKYPDLYPNTNWYDLLFDNTALTTQHSLTFTGGSDKINYFAGLGYVYDQDNLPGRSFSRYNMNLNVKSEMTNWLTLRMGVKYIYNVRNINGGGAYGGIGNGSLLMGQALIVPSIFVAKHTNGEWGSVTAGKEASETFFNGNPLRMLSDRDWIRNKGGDGLYEVGFDLKPIKGLVVSGQGSFKVGDYKNKRFVATRDAIRNFLKPDAIMRGSGNDRNFMYMDWGGNTWETYTSTATYSLEKGIHSFSVLAGTSYEQFKFERLTAQREGFPSDNMTDMSAGLSSGPEYKNGSDSYTFKMLSYFGRLNYVLANKYLFEANLRTDGSSRFHKNNRYGYFPSFSLGWRISEEDFMKSTKDWLNNLKLRASYGSLGNINNVGYYDYFDNYGSRGYYSLNGSPSNSIAEIRPANPGLGWESITMTNMGLDFDLFGSKLIGTIEYYIKKTNNILLAYPVPAEIGISSNPSQNLGKVKNQGLELSLVYRDKIGDFSYSIGGNLTSNKNTILSLQSGKEIIQNMSGHGVGKFILREGESIGSFFGLKTDGLYSQEEITQGKFYKYGGTTPNAGDIKFVPQRKIAYGENITDEDRVILGNDVPNFTYGFNLDLSYKNLSLSVLTQGVNGTMVGFEVYEMHPFFHGADNPRAFHMKRWNEANPDPRAIYPRIYDAGNPHTAYNRTFSDYHLFDADYFRFKTISLSYTFPRTITNRMRIGGMRVYATGENLFTIRADKKLGDFDPESASGVISTLGIRTLALGLNLTF